MTAREFNECLRKIKTEEQAFRKLYNFYFPKIVIHIYLRYGNKNISEDVAQEFFLKLITRETSEYIKSPNAWVYTVSENIAKNIISKEHSERRIILNEEDVLVYDEYAIDLFGEYWSKLENLEEKVRQIIIMRVFEGYKYKEIAEKLNLTEVNVRKIFSRGIKKLK